MGVLFSGSRQIECGGMFHDPLHFEGEKLLEGSICSLVCLCVSDSTHACVYAQGWDLIFTVRVLQISKYIASVRRAYDYLNVIVRSVMSDIR